MWNERGKCYRPTYIGLTGKASQRPDVWEGAEEIAFSKENCVCKGPEVCLKCDRHEKC